MIVNKTHPTLFMPKRRRSDRDAQLVRFRTGNVAPSGQGKPFKPRTKTYNARCSTQMICSSTTAGDHCTFSVPEYNLPLTRVDNASFVNPGTAAEEGFRHPTGHTDAIAQGYASAEVLSCMYRFHIAFTGGNNVLQDWVFAYKFSALSHVSEPIMTAGALTISAWADLRQTRGWVWKRMSGSNSGGSIHPSVAVVDIKVPSVAKLGHAFADETVGDDIDDPFRSLVLDNATVSTFQKACFLHILVIVPSGTALSQQDITIDMDWFGKVKLIRTDIATDFIDDIDFGA